MEGPDYLACGFCGVPVRVPIRSVMDVQRLYGAHGAISVRCAGCNGARFPRGRGGCELCFRRDPGCPACAGELMIMDDWNGDGVPARGGVTGCARAW